MPTGRDALLLTCLPACFITCLTLFFVGLFYHLYRLLRQPVSRCASYFLPIPVMAC